VVEKTTRLGRVENHQKKNKMKKLNWTIRFDEQQELWIAETDTGVRVFADSREELAAWIDG